MDLLYSDVEDDLRANLRAMLAERGPHRAVLARCESEEPVDPALWRTLAVDMGLAGLAVPEEYGGAGAGFREVAVVCEELGRAVAPVPYLGSAVIATATLLAAKDEALLPDLASGARTVALLVPFAAAAAPRDGTGVTAAEDALDGRVTGVADALTADVLLVPADDGLYAVDTAAARPETVDRSAVISLDMTRRLCDVTLRRAPARLVAGGEDARAAVAAGWTAGAALLAAEQVGVAQWCLDSTVDHVSNRYQFGRPIGSFQALKHRLADIWVGVTQARAVARYAVACVAAGDPDTAVAVAVAQAHCGPVAVGAAEECVQMHGGIGFTWEHPAHLYLKRAKADAIAFGTAERHRAALAALVDLPGVAA